MFSIVPFIKFNKLPSAAANLESELERVLDLAVAEGIQRSTPKTPVDRGDLRRNLQIDREEGSRRILWLQDYSLYQDQGTVHNAAHNFAATAAKAGQKVIIRELSSLNLG